MLLHLTAAVEDQLRGESVVEMAGATAEQSKQPPQSIAPDLNQAVVEEMLLGFSAPPATVADKDVLDDIAEVV